MGNDRSRRESEEDDSTETSVDVAHYRSDFWEGLDYRCLDS